jgi:hypothetical protein
MAFGYIETEDICHLDRTNERSFSDPNWRESYYFNMTDPRRGISMITTLGMVPNKKRTSGFVLVTKDGKTSLLRPVGKIGKPAFSDRTLGSGGLIYSVEGVNWRIEYRSRRVDLDLLFRPLNEVFPYSREGDGPIECIATQHYEQAGTFRGKLRIGGDRFDIGPCYGHRDHSWGIRDWSGIDAYTLLSCTFSDRSAVNIWSGEIDGRTFLRGYVFDGKRNAEVVSARIDPFFSLGGRPVSCSFELEDVEGMEYQVGTRVISDHVFPPTGSIVHETIAEIRMDDQVGFGLLEFLERTNSVRRFGATFGLITKMGVAECRW